MHKVTLVLPESEFRAVYALANRELRTPNDQIVWLIRQEAARRGLLDATAEYVYAANDRHDREEGARQ